MKRGLGALAVLAITMVHLLAQAPKTDNPAFEVASIKQNKTAGQFLSLRTQPGGRFTATNVPLAMLVRNAYQIQNFQLVGGPDWMTSDRFDIVAKAEGELTPGQPGTVSPLQLMIRALLADRFKLVVHQEKRELPIYALVLARADGRLGPQLQVSTVDCQAVANAAMARGGQAPPPPAPDGRPTCGMQVGAGSMMAGGFPLSSLTSTLSGIVQRTVVDKTGLTGNYDLTLTYTPEQPAQGPAGVPGPAIDPNGPSIFTALQEQLGLKLDSQRGPVDVLVVDSAQRPVED